MIMKTQLDILTSAEATARLMLTAPNAFAAEQIKVNEFEAAAGDPLDYPLWNQQTNQRLSEYLNLSKIQSPSAQAAALAAKQAAAAQAAAAAVQTAPATSAGVKVG